MKVLEGTNIDLIEPFPVSEAKRAFSWFHCYKNITETDVSPKTPEEFEQFMMKLLPFTRSFGIIDKNNKLNIKHEAPLVGMIIYEPSTIYNCYMHIASPRRAWASGFMDEGILLSLQNIFDTEPSILRVSAMVLENNGPVKGLARRLDFRYEGCLHDFVVQNGQPKNLIHFGMTRRDWVEKSKPKDQPAEQSVVAE